MAEVGGDSLSASRGDSWARCTFWYDDQNNQPTKAVLQSNDPSARWIVVVSNGARSANRTWESPPLAPGEYPIPANIKRFLHVQTDFTYQLRFHSFA